MTSLACACSGYGVVTIIVQERPALVHRSPAGGIVSLSGKVQGGGRGLVSCGTWRGVDMRRYRKHPRTLKKVPPRRVVDKKQPFVVSARQLEQRGKTKPKRV